jgi:hypothetical protein
VDRPRSFHDEGPDVRVKELWAFLRTHKLAWILPIVLFAAIAGLIAWRIAATPAHPFAYDLR